MSVGEYEKFRPVSVVSENITRNHVLPKNWIPWATFLSPAVWSSFNHCDIIGPKATEFGRTKQKITAITPFKVIQCHQFQNHWKVCMRLPMSE